MNLGGSAILRIFPSFILPEIVNLRMLGEKKFLQGRGTRFGHSDMQNQGSIILAEWRWLIHCGTFVPRVSFD